MIMAVTETLQRIRGKGLVVMQPKTTQSRRMISLPPAAAVMLSGLKPKQREQRQLLGGTSTEADYVFAHADGRPMYTKTVSRAFSDMVEEAGIRHVPLHDLRHTHATLMLKQGVNPKIVSERLGHASVVITLDTYSHVLPGLQGGAALKFEEVLRYVADSPLVSGS